MSTDNRPKYMIDAEKVWADTPVSHRTQALVRRIAGDYGIRPVSNEEMEELPVQLAQDGRPLVFQGLAEHKLNEALDRLVKWAEEQKEDLLQGRDDLPHGHPRRMSLEDRARVCTSFVQRINRERPSIAGSTGSSCGCGFIGAGEPLCPGPDGKLLCEDLTVKKQEKNDGR